MLPFMLILCHDSASSDIIILDKSNSEPLPLTYNTIFDKIYVNLKKVFQKLQILEEHASLLSFNYNFYKDDVDYHWY